MSQLSRLISILTLLRSKRLLTATELSEKFNVSIRTIYRDIRKLESSGVPIITVDGRGYSLMDGYYVSPIQFTEKEANALITAQHLVAQTQDKSFIENFENATTKIKAVFRSQVLEKGEFLSKNIYVFDTHKEAFSSDTLAEIQLAITNKIQIEINYRKPQDDKNSFRLIEPVAIYSTHHKWIMVAWCHLRKAYRSFRIDRIQQFKILNTTFEDRNFSLQDYFMADSYRPPKK